MGIIFKEFLKLFPISLERINKKNQLAYKQTHSFKIYKVFI